MSNFAFFFDVSIRTIGYDIDFLTVLHPIETVRGKGGCVRLADGYGTYKNILSQEQQETLIQIVPLIEVRYAIEVKGILISFGSKSNQSRIEGLMV
jgi:predicted DNA-binding transcriptional regulator YafY